MWDLAEEASLGPLAVTRHHLSRGAWVDHLPGWVEGSDEVLEVLLGDIGWRADRRQMYEREVAVPRLLRWYGGDEQLPHPLLTSARDALNAHYGPELGEPFVSAGMCLYRDGRDSVAWHGDRLGRGRSADTMVAIVSFGSPRPLLLRPVGGGEGLALSPGPWQPGRHGRLVPAHVGALHPQDHQTRRPPGQRPVPSPRGGLTRSHAPAETVGGAGPGRPTQREATAGGASRQHTSGQPGPERPSASPRSVVRGAGSATGWTTSSLGPR
jgi:alkylated DNA repair dioxygenase AlkB